MPGSNSYPQGSGFVGQSWYQTVQGSLYNAIHFVVKQIIAGKAGSQLVKVLSVKGGGPSSPPMVSVQIMTDQVDGFGNRTPHGEIFNIPAARTQAGGAAIIIDPKVGDIGKLTVADRDISAVKKTGDISTPGSTRQHSWSDGMFTGCYTSLAGGADPTTTIHMDADGGVTITTNKQIILHSDGHFTIQADNCTLDASGNLAVKGEVTAMSGGGSSVNLSTHTTTEVTSGVQTSGPPTPGS